MRVELFTILWRLIRPGRRSLSVDEVRAGWWQVVTRLTLEVEDSVPPCDGIGLNDDSLRRKE